MASGVRALTKLMIVPYKRVSEKGKLRGIAGVPFVAPYNPTNFSFSGGSEIISKYNAGGGAAKTEVLYPENRKLDVDLFFDGTGASPPLGIPSAFSFGAAAAALAGSSGSSVAAINAEAGVKAVTSSVAVTAWVNYFFGVTSHATFPPKLKSEANPDKINPETHDPNYLKIIWGAGLLFNCRLLSANVKYTLFNQLGLPLRATISASFIEESAKPKKQSPDLTKIHVVNAGDTIYNIAKNEYDDESYYLRIAEANNLRNYRRLVPGQELILPPIAKVEEE